MLDFIFIALGLAGLVWSSDKFVDGAAAIANHAGISPLLIGMTIVSLGTSAPEIVVSIMASLSVSGELAVGNALGSNITNIGLVLGVTLLISSISIDATTTKRELPQMVIVTLLAGVLMVDGFIHCRRCSPSLRSGDFFNCQLDAERPDGSVDSNPELTPLKAWGGFFLGRCIGYLVKTTGRWRRQHCDALGVSELIIGLTIVALVQASRSSRHRS